MSTTAKPKYRSRINDRGDEASVIVLDEDNNVYHADDTNENFGYILECLTLNEFPDHFLQLFSKEKHIRNSLRSLSSRVDVKYGKVYLDGEALPLIFQRHMAEAVEQGVKLDYSFINFWDKTLNNPDAAVKDLLLKWLENDTFTIAPTGNLVAYRGLDNDFIAPDRSPNIVNGKHFKSGGQNIIGSTVEMPMDINLFDPVALARNTLKVGTWSWAVRQSQGTMVAVHVDPCDVLVLDLTQNSDMLYVSRYRVVRKVTGTE